MNGLDRKYLRLADLTRLKRLFFTSRRAVVGRYAGRHVSPQRGRSVEFNDYRQYLPGDSLTDVDWKTYGRSDRLYIKLFEHQSDMAVNILLDASESMAYTGPENNSGGRKYDHAARLAAAIAFLASRQGDRLSFGLAQEGLKSFQAPNQSPNQVNGILDALENTPPMKRAGLAGAIRQMVGALPKRGLLIVISDLLEDQAEVLAALSLFAHRGGQAVVLHVLHADELRLPDVGEAVFIDSELPRRLAVNADELREDYDARIKQFIQGWSSSCAGRGMDYSLVSTATPYHRALELYLHGRAARG